MADQERVPAGNPNGGQFGKGNGGGSGSDDSGGGDGGSTGGSSLKTKGTFTEQQTIELQDYAEGNYQQLNSYLRNPSSVSASLGKELEKQAKTIDAAIAKSTLTKDVVVYRGLQSPKVVANAERLVGITIEAPGFQSTSLSQSVASDFAGFGPGAAVFELTARKGSKALNMEPFKKSKGNAGEAEILFPRDSKVKITGFDKTKRPPVIKGEFV